MLYLISQVLLLLVIASLLSAAIGWLCRRFIADNAHADEIRSHQRAGRRQVAEIDDLRRELTDRNSEVADLNSRLHHTRSAIDSAEAEKSGLYDDLEQMRGLENDYQVAAAELDRIDQERANTEAALKHALKAEAEKEAELQGLLQSDSNNQEQLRASVAAVGNLEEVIASLNHEVGAQNAAAEKAAKQQAVLAGDIDKLEQKLAASEALSGQKISDLEKNLRNEKDSLGAARQAITTGEEKIRGLEALLAERGNEKAKLEQLTAKQQQEIAALQREINQLQKDATEAKSNSLKAVTDLEHALEKQTALAATANTQAANQSQLKDKLQQDVEKLNRDLQNTQAAANDRNTEAKNQIEQQKRATVDANAVAIALENKLKELNREQTALKQQAASTTASLNDSEKDVARREEKIASAQKAIADLESELARRAAETGANEQRFVRELGSRDAEIKGKDGELKDALNQNLALREKLAEHQSSDAELRAMIVELQSLLSAERRLAGQSLLSRIKELEAMLEAERRKADELREIPEVTNLSWSSMVRTNAANGPAHNQKTGTDNNQ